MDIDTELEFHPYADIFPLIEGDELRLLADDIRQHGLKEPILLYEDKILDGRNRYLACKIAGVEPLFETYKGADPVSHVVSLNVHRRHLSEPQRALVAARIVNLKHGDNRFTIDASNEASISQPDAAEMMKVSRSSVQRAAIVLDEGTPELIEKVEKDQLPISRAAILTQMPKEELVELLKSPDLEQATKEAANQLQIEKRQKKKAKRDARIAVKPVPLSAPDGLTVICGDALTELRKLPSDSVQCCVTSPPYYSLRDYGTADWTGGDPDCDHIADESRTKTFGNPEFNEGRPSREDTKTPGYYYDDVCGKCGATSVDQQIGLEDDIFQYIDKLVEVFREVRRVLKPDGVCWIVIGDSYVGGYGGKRNDTDRQIPRNNGSASCPSQKTSDSERFKRGLSGLKPKNLCLVPERLAISLQEDDWIVRSRITWSKPNFLPESVKDRCSKSDEAIFMLTKNPEYYFDAWAIRQPCAESSKERYKYEFGGDKMLEQGHNNQIGFRESDGFRNCWTVWEIPTQPTPYKHAATFPEALVERCVLASSRAGDTVLDFFAGSGTTGKVALSLGRLATLIELNPDYIKIIEERVSSEKDRPTD